MKRAGGSGQRSISPACISPSQHLGIGPSSDRSFSSSAPPLQPLPSLTVPTRGELSTPTPTAFPLCKLLFFPFPLAEKSSTPRAHQFSKTSDLNTRVFFFLSHPLPLLQPPLRSSSTREKKVFFPRRSNGIHAAAVGE